MPLSIWTGVTQVELPVLGLGVATDDDALLLVALEIHLFSLLVRSLV